MKTPRSEFRLRTAKPVVEDEAVIVRAQAILAAHEELGVDLELSAEDRRTLRIVARRASTAAALHPNEPVELSPYMVALLRLED